MPVRATLYAAGMHPLSIQGPAGALEAMVDAPPQPGSALALLCHPHPLYGGSMHDAVLGTLGQALQAAGINCLRFNFRGVGASDGRFDNGRGEAQDLLAVVDWADQQGAGALWLCGYSFGAHVVCQALARIGSPERVLLVAPPNAVMSIPPPVCPCPLDLIAGDRDEFVNCQDLASWAGARTHVISGADHFFSGSGSRLLEAVQATLAAA